MRTHLFIGMFMALAPLGFASPAHAGEVAVRAAAKGSGLSEPMRRNITWASAARSGDNRPIGARGRASLYSSDTALPTKTTKNGERFSGMHFFQTVPVDNRVNREESRELTRVDVKQVGTTTVASQLRIENVKTTGNGWNGYGHISDHKVSTLVEETVKAYGPNAKVRTTKTFEHKINSDGTRSRSNTESRTLIIGAKEVHTWTPKQ